MSLKPDRTVALGDEENDKQLSDKDQSPQLIVDQGMVHALREAHRVLKPAGLLIDLRPRSAHRPVSITCNGPFQPLGIVHRNLDDVRAANRAVARSVRAGLFKIEERIR